MIARPYLPWLLGIRSRLGLPAFLFLLTGESSRDDRGVHGVPNAGEVLARAGEWMMEGK